MAEERRGGRRQNAGRKALDDSKRRKARYISFTDEEWKRIDEKAALAGMTAPEYIRKICL